MLPIPVEYADGLKIFHNGYYSPSWGQVPDCYEVSSLRSVRDTVPVKEPSQSERIRDLTKNDPKTFIGWFLKGF